MGTPLAKAKLNCALAGTWRACVIDSAAVAGTCRGAMRGHKTSMAAWLTRALLPWWTASTAAWVTRASAAWINASMAAWVTRADAAFSSTSRAAWVTTACVVVYARAARTGTERSRRDGPMPPLTPSTKPAPRRVGRTPRSLVFSVNTANDATQPGRSVSAAMNGTVRVPVTEKWTAIGTLRLWVRMMRVSNSTAAWVVARLGLALVSASKAALVVRKFGLALVSTSTTVCVARSTLMDEKAALIGTMRERAFAPKPTRSYCVSELQGSPTADVRPGQPNSMLATT